MKWISYNIFQNFPLFRIHRVRGTGVSFPLILVLATKLRGADARFHFFKYPPKMHGSGRTVDSLINKSKGFQTIFSILSRRF